ncbi:MAG TPA: DUF99 family protein [Methanomassiliicoccales archaeon]|jgi:hypothetical protein
MKRQVRVLGIDDAPFSFRDGKVPIVGVVVRLPGYVEGVIVSEVTVDGDDADQVITDLILRSRYREQIRMVMIDGTSLGGFNVVDIDRLSKDTGIPFCTVTRDRPDIDSMRGALQKHFPDWQRRMEIVERHRPVPVQTGHGPIFASITGASSAEMEELLRGSTIQGAIPEPIRMAHLIAAAMVKGESKGNP